MKNLLLPHYWRYVGIILTLAGLFFTVLYLLFDFTFKVPVFAVYSSFLETKMLVTIKTNFSDELTLLLLVTGMGLMVFSREKTENEINEALRLNALAKALILNLALTLLSVIFVYGSGFIGVLVFNLISVPLFYLLIFHWQKRKWQRRSLF